MNGVTPAQIIKLLPSSNHFLDVGLYELVALGKVGLFRYK